MIISSTPSIKFYTEIIEQENLPIDLAVIPLLESGNNPLARSPKDALGLWQFIPSTAKEWGLATNRIDNRKNVVSSGVYFFQISTGENIKRMKMILLK